MRILIAEDDLTSRKILEAVLKKFGYEVIVTNNGLSALDEMKTENAPRLAIMDWMMPELDGLEVVRRIRALEQNPPPYIILLTAKDEKADIIKGLDVGADDYLSKPFDVGELKARLSVGTRMLDMQDKMAAQVKELQEALDHIKTLQGILPICTFCKKIRNDQGYWDQVEHYIGERSQAQFSHSICADCIKKHYPEVADDLEDD